MEVERLAQFAQMYPAWRITRVERGWFATRVDSLTEEQKASGLIASLGRPTAEQLRDALGDQLLLEEQGRPIA